ncbi:MAG: UDP-N-acetylglucosamine 1-carboxyvinyltransferase [Candidatus Nealsonbacteria bacterium RIFCSPLOWO2_12_FULL_39_31]|uniref:UDP-N-acetylglucosamine 1-carboxyvinyltransferase n=3 Tax=Candidatus Nealsoniibacteriota TaxID=1817911 RepID=A0A1G2EIN8_9BACT|nr:MAG: UDP-N-acetylglucosamine 1-carboxyvinyltransferase [Parcubacteria group bacterium GW2011_GWA2_38_27]OGZ19447.1 MAG: UDP-N-acetylglucosamine 1-carboxyvinyltransferase [Candidatus Nealsonbacteria bacterium RIFCSPHIGHO2_01_FULL_38_55]OGZ21180.1 MAG: UDP-N-acetylglucosamine 1-carboxyvinyltransferase [Candidatus Nealsonbacteria bacterium RIFCSPHIGHO2_02_38_10]OGZ21470.1 MAG: UDP-N-acetylglucosamine 1-carboxyvinyltransferase [Candidatus Nealsonbacteria bacterium RIFCSPHIGHO2_02_FULL_38_75]OGZ2
MAEKFVIKGGKPLRGEVEIRGAKNAAFPILAASLLTKEDCVVSNLPLIEDVFQMLKILEELGVKIFWIGRRTVKLNSFGVDLAKIPFATIKKFRGSILILGPLISRFGELKIPPPGGCLIGARPIDTHLDAFSQLGVDVSSKNGFYFFKSNGSRRSFASSFAKTSEDKKASEGTEVVLREFSVTATENTLLFSALCPQKTILKIADLDYQIQELVKVLIKMGADIKYSGPHCFEIIGAEKLNGFEYNLISDPIEAGTFIVAALATKGEVLIKNVELEFLDLFLKRLKDFGAKFQILDKKTIKIFPSENLKIDKVQSLIYPGINSDLQPELGVLATQTEGQTLIHDPLYEGRLKYLDELNKMGADIVFCDPHRAIINGPSKLVGAEIPSPDLRAGAALIIAGLVAKGKTTISNIYQIDRGYEKIEERLQKLRADIKRVKE